MFLVSGETGVHGTKFDPLLFPAQTNKCVILLGRYLTVGYLPYLTAEWYRTSTYGFYSINGAPTDRYPGTVGTVVTYVPYLLNVPPYCVQFNILIPVPTFKFYLKVNTI